MIPKDYYEVTSYGKRKVQKDCHVYVDYSYYSVPCEYVGKQVDIEEGQNTIRIFSEGEEVALHVRSKEKGSFTTVPEHYPKYKDIHSTEHQLRYHEKMESIGTYAGKYFNVVLGKNPKTWNRSIQGILSLTKTYPKEVVDRACQRALYYEATGYRVIKNICENGSYHLPLEGDAKK